MDAFDAPPTQFAAPPSPPSERGAWLLACALGTLGTLVLALALSGVLTGSSAIAPPRVLIARVATPRPQPARVVSGNRAGAGTRAAIVQSRSAEEQALDQRRFTSATHVQISREWLEGFYPIYATAQATFGVDWLLLASIHAQESAFSTAPGTYHGLNFAHCCAGPMQFNVTNGPVTTWDLVADSYRYGARPARYDHMTARHPSVYDDFDAIMAAAHLLSADGAGVGLEDAAWWAAYDYYGHDATGVLYADQVLARAIGWSQHGFCFNCGVDPELVHAVDAAYGAPVMSALAVEERAERAARPPSRPAGRQAGAPGSIPHQAGKSPEPHSGSQPSPPGSASPSSAA